jgi:hypothetical protein
MGLQLSGSVQLEGNLLVTGSANSVFENISVTNRITANEINVQFVSSSIIYSSGSNKFGDEITDNHQFTGSLIVSGTLAMGIADKGVGRISFNESTNTLRIQSSKDGTACTPIEFWSQRDGGGFAQSMIISGSNTGLGGHIPNASYGPLQIKSPASSYTLDLVGRTAGLNGESQISFWNAAQSSILASVGNVGDKLLISADSVDVSGSITMDNTEFFKLSVGTTAQRPVSPSTGMMRFNTDVNFLEFYNGSFWQSTAGVNSSFTSAVGGETTTISENGITYRVHFFTSVGSSTFQVVSGNNPIEYLVVAGGGGGAGGYDNGNGTGGGGAGGFLTGSITLSPNSYTVVVGGGGLGGISSATNTPVSENQGASGGTSTFHNISATGGGGGGRNGFDGANGGSGGGGGNSASGGAGIAGQGFNGGNGGESAIPFVGGGGGGAAAVGALGVGGSGNGGAGKSSSISGTSLFYAGGGGGGANAGRTSGTGGSSVGGNGSSTANVAGGNGATNRGAGGGGGTWGGSFTGTSSAGGNGGSGIVIVRYRIF